MYKTVYLDRVNILNSSTVLGIEEVRGGGLSGGVTAGGAGKQTDTSAESDWGFGGVGG